MLGRRRVLHGLVGFGTLLGAALLAPALLVTPSLAWAAPGKALSFDGVDDAAQVPDADGFSPAVNDLSLSVWVKIPTTAPAVGDGGCGGAGRYLVAKGNTNAWEWGLENDKNSRLCFTAWQLGGTIYTSASTGRTLNDGLWHHYAATLDYGVQLVLYIDGKAVNTQKSFTGAMGNGAQPVLLGKRGDGQPFLGVLDELRLYSRALTPNDVATIYNLQQPGAAEANLVGGWHVDEGAGTTATDYSGGGRTATLSGGVAWVDGLIPVPSDATPPTVSLTAPAAGATVSGSAVVSASASDNVGVVGVQFKLDGAALGAEDTTSPYSVSWNTTTATNGSHTLTAAARDAAGNSATATAVTVTVSNATGGTAPPTVTNLQVSPSARLYVGQAATLTATATGTGTGLQYQFLLDGAIIRDWAAGNTASWTPAAASLGQRTLVVNARDSNGTGKKSMSLLVIRQPLRP